MGKNSMPSPMEQIERLKAQRDAALDVAAASYREALTEPIWRNGEPGPGLAELAQVEVEDRANFRIQDDIADVLVRWTVPPAHRPICPLDQKPCTHWSCLVDVCVDAKKERVDAN